MKKDLARLGGKALAETATHRHRFQITGSTGRIYVVSQHKASGEFQCSCPGWIMKKPGKPRGCKHLAAILPSVTGGRAALPKGR